MGRSQKPRKRYSPRIVDYDPVSLAMNRAAVMTGDEQRLAMSPVKSALGKLREGHGSMAVWGTLADTMNIAEQLVLLKIGTNLAEEISTAQMALAELNRRVNAGRGWTLYAEELKAISYAVELYGIQLGLCSTGELLQAIEKVKRKSRGVLSAMAAGTVSAHITVASGD